MSFYRGVGESLQGVGEFSGELLQGVQVSVNRGVGELLQGAEFKSYPQAGGQQPFSLVFLATVKANVVIRKVKS